MRQVWWEPYIIAYSRKERVIVESSFRGWEDARIVLSERGDFEWGILFFFRMEIYDWKVENNQFVVNCSAVERINMIVGDQ